jgi:hypothetical protein
VGINLGFETAGCYYVSPWLEQGRALNSYGGLAKQRAKIITKKIRHARTAWRKKEKGE